MEKFKLGFDKATNRIVHIDQVTAGFDSAICPDCKSVLIASNLNANSRQRDTYFRHRVTASCNQMTLMHLWAQQIISESSHFMIPTTVLEADDRDISNNVHSSSKIVDEKIVTIKSSCLEKRIDIHDGYVRADVFMVDASEHEFIVEVFVKHKSDSEKIQYLRNNNIEAIEVKLLPAPDGILNDPDGFKKYVLEDACRYWLHCIRYDSYVKDLQDAARKMALESSHNIRALKKYRDDERAAAKSKKASWRENNGKIVSLLNAYSLPDNRTKVMSKFNGDFFDPGGIFHATYKELIVQYGNVPAIFNVQLQGELSFKCHRSVWQWEVYRETVVSGIKSLKEFSDRPLRGYYADFNFNDYHYFDPLTIYSKIRARIPITKIAFESEIINCAPLISERRDIKNNKFYGLTTREWESLPKPVCTIRRYMNYLVGMDLLCKLSGDSYSVKV
ncbi:MAG: hypothetical protein Q7T48_01255 [Cellvibrio sp.]|uniref:hypothetical protein n=1 Tax=Cellvibrio sp. TaxID=1965322 RepID=UPI002720B0A4|nr:hypothetical protein [Cellvibrio sp.]